MRFSDAKRVWIVALLALLVAAQTVALTHADRDDAHPTNDICALCVGLATLGAGNVSTPFHVAVVVAPADPTDYLLQHPVIRRVARPLSRGPPQAS